MTEDRRQKADGKQQNTLPVIRESLIVSFSVHQFSINR